MPRLFFSCQHASNGKRVYVELRLSVCFSVSYGEGSSILLATCETSQVLLAGVSGGFSRGSPVFAPPTDWPVSYELKKS